MNTSEHFYLPRNPDPKIVRKARNHEAMMTPRQQNALNQAGIIYRTEKRDPFYREVAGLLIRYANERPFKK